MNESTDILRNEPMRKHTSWRVGGPADLFFRPHSVDQLEQFLKVLPPGTPLTWIGLGSNLLVRDGGIRGAVVCTSGLPKELDVLEAGRVRVGAGLPCATLARRCARLGLGPAAFFAGIPGTVGGALAMNAGAFGGEAWDHVVEVQTIDRTGVVRRRTREEFEIAYRSVGGAEGEWFLSAILGLQAGQEQEAVSIRALLRERGEKQPLGLPSAGSVFRNPPEDHAGRLIERTGLKGARVGGAEVSDKHANFIINTGSATAADIEALIELVVRTVLEATGVRLEPEVRVIGETIGSGA